MYLTVDLASKFSAAIVRDQTGKVHWQGDSMGLSAHQWVERLGKVVEVLKSGPLYILVEDVPYGISNQAMVKPVLRLEGMLIRELGALGLDFYFINPSTWQKDYPGVGRAPKGLTKAEGDKYRIDKAIDYARELGYSAPDLVQQYIDSLPPGSKVLKKDTKPLEKAMTDYTDAFLMSDWLMRHRDDYTSLSGVQIAYI